MNYFEKQKVNNKDFIEFTIEEKLLKANALLVKEETQGAEKYYKEILDSNPNHPDANHNLGLIKLSNHETKSAIKLFLNAINTNPKIEQFWISYVNALISFQKFEDAKEAVKNAQKQGLNKDIVNKLKLKLINNNSQNRYSDIPSKDELQQLVNLYNTDQNIEAENLAKFLIKQYPNHPFSWKVLGALLGKFGREGEALEVNKKAVELSPGDIAAHNNLGNTLKNLGKLKEAEVIYRKAISIQNNFHVSHNNLGITLAEMGRLEEAESSYREAIKIKPNFEEAYFNLGLMFYEANNFEKAIKEFKLTKFGKSESYLLRCLYLMKEKSLFYNQLDNLINQGEINAMIGSLCSRSALKYGIEKTNLFCKNPMKYVLNVNLKNKYDFKKVFVDTAMAILTEDRLPYREQSLLTNGRQTSGNLFNYKYDFILEIEKIIRDEIENYRYKHRHSDEGLIKKWPNDYIVSGWLISMKSGSQIRPHMHEKGWISGSIYINVPPKINSDNGNLVVCIEDEEFVERKIKNPKKVINVITGSLALFPASLLHYTIPFISEEERVVLAFDIIPK